MQRADQLPPLCEAVVELRGRLQRVGQCRVVVSCVGEGAALALVEAPALAGGRAQVDGAQRVELALSSPILLSYY